MIKTSSNKACNYFPLMFMSLTLHCELQARPSCFCCCKLPSAFCIFPHWFLPFSPVCRCVAPTFSHTMDIYWASIDDPYFPWKLCCARYWAKGLGDGSPGICNLNRATGGFTPQPSVFSSLWPLSAPCSLSPLCLFGQSPALNTAWQPFLAVSEGETTHRRLLLLFVFQQTRSLLLAASGFYSLPVSGLWPPLPLQQECALGPGSGFLTPLPSISSLPALPLWFDLQMFPDMLTTVDHQRAGRWCPVRSWDNLTACLCIYLAWVEN